MYFIFVYVYVYVYVYVCAMCVAVKTFFFGTLLRWRNSFMDLKANFVHLIRFIIIL